MLLTISTTHTPATDLGFLLHKNPAKVQTFPQAFGEAIVFYPEASAARCTVALLVDIDPLHLVRGAGMVDGPLTQYVNDKPYAASSLLAVAVADVFRSALAGRCKDMPDLPAQRLPLQLALPALPCRGGAALLRDLFAPLGYLVEAEALPFDAQFPEWGDSPYFRVTLSAEITLQSLLAHLYVLLPVLDNDKHYWVGDEEVDKLLRHAGDWLANHPLKEMITRRYLKHQVGLVRQALQRLEVLDDEDDEEESAAGPLLAREAELERPISLNLQRMATVLAEIAAIEAESVLDVGCGSGKLLTLLAKQRGISRVCGMDVSSRALELAESRLQRLAPMQRERVSLLHGSLTYRDRRLQGFDVATCVEVIEHLDASRVGALERTLFEFARPAHVVLTTPNHEYNVLFPGLAAGAFRHADHRFEWTRSQFASWAKAVAMRHGYAVWLSGIGQEDANLGMPTQMAVFTRHDKQKAAGRESPMQQGALNS